VAAATVVLPAAPASAAVPGTVYVSVSSATDSNVYKSVTASCPTGKRIISGGYQLVGAPGSVVLDDFIPTATGVTVGAGEVVGPGEPSDGTTQSWRVIASAVCANELPGLTVGSQTSSFGATTGNSVEVDCPLGEKVVGAGSSSRTASARCRSTTCSSGHLRTGQRPHRRGRLHGRVVGHGVRGVRQPDPGPTHHAVDVADRQHHLPGRLRPLRLR